MEDGSFDFKGTQILLTIFMTNSTTQIKIIFCILKYSTCLIWKWQCMDFFTFIIQWKIKNKFLEVCIWKLLYVGKKYFCIRIPNFCKNWFAFVLYNFSQNWWRNSKMNLTSVTRLTKKWFSFDLFLILISENEMKK